MISNTVTLRDIALAAHVSLGAVSKVLGGSKCNIRVSSEKAELIRATAQRLNYRPNITARRLAGGSGRIIGVILDSNLPIHYYRTITRIEHKFAEKDYRVMVSESHGSAQNFINAHRTLLQYGIDGTICISHDYPGENHLIEEYFRVYPNTVFIGRPVAGCHMVDLDWAASTEYATRHLLNAGRRHLALVLGEVPYISRQDRINGFTRALADFPDAAVNSRIYSFAELDSDMPTVDFDKVFASLPDELDGIILENDLKAITMMRVLHKRGCRVPDDVAIIGHNNEDFSSCCYPALSTIDECSDEQADATFELLLQQLSVNPPQSPRTVTVTPRLIIRETSC